MIWLFFLFCMSQKIKMYEFVSSKVTRLPDHCVNLIIEYYKEFEMVRKKEQDTYLFNQIYGKCLTLTADFLVKSAQKHRKLTKAFNFALGENFSNEFRMGDVPKDNNGGTMISQTSTGEPITVYRLDDIWKEHGQPRIDLIKIDVEGHELACFLGGLELLKRNRPFIIFEDWLVQKGDFRVFNLLRELGYVIKEVNLPNDFFAFPVEKEEDHFLISVTKKNDFFFFLFLYFESTQPCQTEHYNSSPARESKTDT